MAEEQVEQNEAEATEAEDTSPEHEPQEHETDTSPGEEDGEERFTKDEVEEIVRKRLQRERRKLKRELQAEEKPKPQPKRAKSETRDSESGERETLRERLERVELREEFTDAAAELGLSRAQRKRLMRIYLKEKPEGDPAEWIEETLEELGVSLGEPSTPKQTKEPPRAEEAADAKPEKPAEPKQPVEQSAPSRDPSAYTPQDNPLHWSKDVLDRILSEKGVTEGRKYIRQQLEQHLEKVKVVPT